MKIRENKIKKEKNCCLNNHTYKKYYGIDPFSFCDLHL